MLLDSYEHAEEDKGARLLLGERVEAERVISATRSAMRDDAALLTDEWRAAIDAAMEDLQARMAGTSRHAIHDGIEALDRASQGFAEARMNRSIDRAMRGRRIEDLEHA